MQRKVTSENIIDEKKSELRVSIAHNSSIGGMF